MPDGYSELTTDIAVSRLNAAGFHVSSGALRIERRDQRWLVEWGGADLAWFAAGPAGLAQLRKEGIEIAQLRPAVGLGVGHGVARKSS